MSCCRAVRDLPQAGSGRRGGRPDCSNRGQITFRVVFKIRFCGAVASTGTPANSPGYPAGGRAVVRRCWPAVWAMPKSAEKNGDADGALAQVCRLVARDVDGGLAGDRFCVGANRGNRAVGIAVGDDVAAWDRTAPAVPRTGIPMGATELSTPRVSPMTSGTSPLGAAGNITTCSSIGGSLPQASSGMGGSIPGISSSSAMSTTGTPGSSGLFDGGGTMGNASGTCMGVAGGSTARAASSASSPTGMGLGSPVARVGIPLGSTELGVGGLSPPPDVLTVDPTSPASTSGLPCPTGAPSTTGTSSGSC